MQKRIEKVAVLGAGTMGARISAHLANAGVPSYLLDIVPPDADGPVRNKIAAAGLEAAVKSKPAAFFKPSLARLVTVGNFEDDLQKLSGVDWIIEAVVENLEIKRGLLRKIEAIRKPGTIITTNTSGLPIAKIVEDFPDEFRRHWFGTHFFNPPRYMRLLELIPTPDADPAAMDTIARFCDLRLGKGVVHAKDTPNFIANRIGTFSALNVMRLMQEMDLSIEEVDALTGTAVGWPKTATFRLTDLVGLDVLGHVVRNAMTNIQDERSDLKLPDFFLAMLERKWLGDKTKGGFYKKQKGARGRSAFRARLEDAGISPAAAAEVGRAGNGEDGREPARAAEHAAGAVEGQGCHLPMERAHRSVDLCRQSHWRDCRLGGRDRSRPEAGLQLGAGAVRTVGRRRRREDRETHGRRGQTGFAERREAAGVRPYHLVRRRSQSS